MRTTIKDIAKRVGVSTSLVSLHLNNHPLASRIANETKNKIDKAVSEMNYQASATARSLRNGKSNTIGLVIGRIYSVFSSFYAEALLHEVDKYGYHLLISSTRFNKENERKCLLNLINRQADGIIYNLHLDPQEQTPSYLKTYPLLMTHYPHQKFNTVLTDESTPIQDMCQLMQKMNCRKIFSTYLFNVKSISVDPGIKVICRPYKDFESSSNLLEAVRAEKADVLEFGSCILARRFLNDMKGEKNLPYIVYPYTLPCDYLEHPRIIGVIANPFQEMITCQVKRMIEMIEKPEKEISHIRVATKFIVTGDLYKMYQEQLNDSCYKEIIEERGILM